MRSKKLFAVLLTLVFVLTFSLSAFAEGTQAPQGNTLDQRIQKVQAAKDASEKVAALKAEIQVLRDMHQKVTELRKQLNTMQKEQIRPALKKAREGKNYDALLKALNDLKQVQADLQTVKQMNEQNQTNWNNMRSLRESKDFNGAMSALKQIEANIQTKIDSLNKAMVDMNKVLSDLKTPA